eukprot:gene7906-5525_t
MGLDPSPGCPQKAETGDSHPVRKAAETGAQATPGASRSPAGAAPGHRSKRREARRAQRRTASG